jgi:hypothetical protein
MLCEHGPKVIFAAKCLEDTWWKMSLPKFYELETTIRCEWSAKESVNALKEKCKYPVTHDGFNIKAFPE